MTAGMVRVTNPVIPGSWRPSVGVAATPGGVNAGQTVVAPPPPPPSPPPSSSLAGAGGSYVTTASSSSSPQGNGTASSAAKTATSAGYTFAVVAALAVTWIFYIGGMFRYYI
jgi:hypothetical protein